MRQAGSALAHLLALLALLVLAGCAGAPPKGSSSAAGARKGQGSGLPHAGSGRGGYYQDDGPGDNLPPDLDRIPDAQPRVEPYAKANSRPYVVFGTTYTPITHDLPFSQRGVGSWYGKKFHDLPTASGEPYDMYKMTAAHPTLPIPSYVRLTSVDSGKQVIVRINDRGPFHAGRIVDVSYVAALKLGLLAKGSHDILLERLLPADIERMASGAAPPQPVRAPALAAVSPLSQPVPAGIAEMMLAEVPLPVSAPVPIPVPVPVPVSMSSSTALAADGVARGAYYLQLGAFSHAGNAEQMRARLAPHAGTLVALDIVHSSAVHRLYGGPFHSRAEAEQAAAALADALSLTPLVVWR